MNVPTPQARPQTTRYAEARKLCWNMGQGTISPRRVQLAAYLGNPAARLATGFAEPARSGPATVWHARRGLSNWFEGLRTWGKETWVRAALACAELALPDYERRHPEDTGPRRTLDAATRWLCCPCAEHARQATAAVAAAAHASVDFSACAALRAAQAAATDGRDSLSHARTAAEDAAWVVSSAEGVQARVRLAVVPWALGYSRLQLAGLRVA